MRQQDLQGEVYNSRRCSQECLGPHPSSKRCQHVRFLSAMKAREETTRMHTMYDHQVSTEDPTHLPTLPSFSSMISALYRHQQWIRRAAGLALLPADQVQYAWLGAMDGTSAVPRAEDFNDYLVVNWVDYDARFPLQMWNHGPTDKQQSRWIPQQIELKPSTQPPEHLPLLVEKADKMKLAQIDFGAAQPSRKRVYCELDNRIQRLKEQLHRGIKASGLKLG